MSHVDVLPSDRLPTALALPRLSKVNAENVPRNRLFQHRLPAGGPATINFELVFPGSPSVPFLNVCADGGLIAFDPKGAWGTIFLPEALMNVKLSIGFRQALEEFFFINP